MGLTKEAFFIEKGRGVFAELTAPRTQYGYAKYPKKVNR